MAPFLPLLRPTLRPPSLDLTRRHTLGRKSRKTGKGEREEERELEREREREREAGKGNSKVSEGRKEAGVGRR